MNFIDMLPISLTRQTVIDIIAAHLYAMGGIPERKDIANIQFPAQDWSSDFISMRVYIKK